MADLKELRSRALAIAQRPTSSWTSERVARLSLLLGVLHELTRHEELGGGLSPLPSIAAAPAELVACAAGIEAGSTPSRWRSGFHFNNALHRLRILGEELGWVRRTENKKPPRTKVEKDKSPGWKNVRQDDNSLKHHGAVPLKKQQWLCTAADLGERAAEIISHFETWQ